VRTAARLALPHRRRRTPFEAPGLDEEQLSDALDSVEPDPGPDDDGAAAPRPPDLSEPEPAEAGPGSDSCPEDAEAPDRSGPRHAPAGSGADRSTQQAPAGTFKPVQLTVPGVNTRGGAAGRRSLAEGGSGKLTGARLPASRLRSLHLTATLRAAAPHQTARGRQGAGVELRAQDLREAVREGREGNLVLFVVDASGSMAARQRMSAVKGAVLSLLTDAYQRRDKVALVSFRGGQADLVLPATSSVDAAARRLTDLPTGGRTPLTAGLLRAAEVLRVEAVRDPSRRSLVVVVTDGRHTSGPAPELAAAQLARSGAACVVVDCESGPVRLGLAAALGRHLGAVCLRLEELSAQALTAVVKAA
jgi:magnesium chelatase subunit D